MHGKHFGLKMFKFKDYILGKIDLKDIMPLDDPNIYIRWFRRDIHSGSYMFYVIGRVPHDFDSDVDVFNTDSNSLSQFLKYRRDNPFNGGVVKIFNVIGRRTNVCSQAWTLFNKLKKAYPSIDFK